MSTTDGYISLSKAAKLIPGQPSRQATYRWATEGLEVRGSVYRLRVIRTGHRLLTRPEWVAQFIHDTNDVRNTRKPPSRRAKQRLAAEIEDECKALNV